VKECRPHNDDTDGQFPENGCPDQVQICVNSVFLLAQNDHGEDLGTTHIHTAELRSGPRPQSNRANSQVRRVLLGASKHFMQATETNSQNTYILQSAPWILTTVCTRNATNCDVHDALLSRNGKWIAFLSCFYPKRFTLLPHIHPGRVRWCLAQGHLHT